MMGDRRLLTRVVTVGARRPVAVAPQLVLHGQLHHVAGRWKWVAVVAVVCVCVCPHQEARGCP